MVERIGRQSES